MASPLGGVAPRARRRPRWLVIAMVLLLVVPIIEISAIIAVGRVIGPWPTVLLLIAESAFGAWLVRREGSRAWQALTRSLQTGAMPSRELADAALILIGGTLLLTPGFVTDVVGFLCILPFTRPLARGVLEAAVATRLLGGFGGAGRFAGAGGGSRSYGPGDARSTTIRGEARRTGEDEPLR